jgi:Fe2+ or Zn2+ uptake regulation protein
MTPEPATLLRTAGLRVTEGRVAVLDELDRAPHSNADTVFRRLSASHARMSVQSVHNVLSDLARAGLIGRIEPAGSAALYERRTGDNHHHIVCTSCRSVGDIDCLHGEAPCLTPGDSGGYVVQSAEIIFWGLCSLCAPLSATTFPNPSIALGEK